MIREESQIREFEAKEVSLMIEQKYGRLRILSNAKNKLARYNSQYEPVREYYLDVLRARGNNKSLIGPIGKVSMGSLGKVEKALRSYLRMDRGGMMEVNKEGSSFTERLNRKLRRDDIRVILRKLRDVHILSPGLHQYEPDARHLYECLSAPGEEGLAKENKSFCVGATKIMHCLFPELFVMLDKEMAKALYHNGYRDRKGKYNNFTTYWKEAMQACHDELEAWREIYGSTDSLLELDGERPTTLVRIFDKCRRYSVGAN